MFRCLGSDGLGAVTNKFLESYTQWEEILDHLNILINEVREPLSNKSPLQSKLSTCLNHIRLAIEILRRDDMKIIFLGGTSEGKSTLINALLGLRLLPASIGHTTSCFTEVVIKSGNSNAIQITHNLNETDCKIDEELIGEDLFEKTIARAFKKLTEKAKALAQPRQQNGNLVKNDLLKVKVPASQCKLAPNFVSANQSIVLIDSPGRGVSNEVDAWLLERYRGGDMFVLTLGSNGTLSDLDINMLKKLHEHEVFDLCIANTKWDTLSDNPEVQDFGEEDNLEEHTTERHRLCRNLLVKELKVCKDEEANDRIFFVSGREALLDSLGVRAHDPSDEKMSERKGQFEKLSKHIINTASEFGLRRKLEKMSCRNQKYSETYEVCVKIMYGLDAEMARLMNKLTQDQKRDKADLKSMSSEDTRFQFNAEMADASKGMTQTLLQEVTTILKELNVKIMEYSEVKYDWKESERFCQALSEFIKESLLPDYIEQLDTIVNDQISKLNTQLDRLTYDLYGEAWNREREPIVQPFTHTQFVPKVPGASYSYFSHGRKLIFNRMNMLGASLWSLGTGALGGATAAAGYFEAAAVAAVVVASPAVVVGMGTGAVGGSIYWLVKYRADRDVGDKDIKERASQYIQKALLEHYKSTLETKMEECKKEFTKLINDLIFELRTRQESNQMRIEKIMENMDECQQIRVKFERIHEKFEKFVEGGECISQYHR